jgi:amino acid adenylation domain-containing protein/non-ribosomal peptide synthase protein (TIGR01720 family)
VSLQDRVTGLSPEQRALFEKLREKQRKAAARPAGPPPVRRVTGPTAEGDWPLSLDQERFWFMEQLYPEGAGLNISAASRMRGRISVPRFGSALLEIARRHAAWRTTFPDADGRPVQRVAPAGGPRLALVDLSHLPEPRREAEALRLVGIDSAAPFDLRRGPLVRASLLRMGGEDHVCLLTIHHLVTDWISFQIVWSELAALYGGAQGLPEPPVQYPDFAVWQREWLQGEVLEGLVSWWRERLADTPLVLELPTDRPRLPVARMRGEQRMVSLPRELSDGLHGLAQREGATLFMAVLAATAALLCRWSGQERLILGANNANRNRPEIEPVLGCFLTQVPFPIDLTGDPPFRELLARVRQSALGALSHQDLPFGKLVEAVHPERDTSRQPLVQALVQVLDAHPSQASLAGLVFEPVDAFDGNARYDLMLGLYDGPAGLAGPLEFDVDLFDGVTIERLLGRLHRLVAAVAADPSLRLDAIPLLSPAELEQIARAEQGPVVEIAPACLHDLVAGAPDALAVICGSERLTYRELDEGSAALAARLRELGVGPEVPVAVCAERSVRLVVALLGVLRAGGVYLPIDPEDTPSRIAFVLRDAGAAALVAQPAIAARLPATGVPAVDPDAPLPPASAPVARVVPENLAYLIYTSGSTGLPKGVGVSHAAAVQHVRTWATLHGVDEEDRFLQFNSASFDPAVEQCLTVLLTGATLVMRGSRMWDPDELTAQIVRHEVTVVDLPTAYWSRWVGEVTAALPSVRRVLIGGEELRAESVRQWSRTPLARLPLLNGYGPTEAVVSVTQHAVRPADADGGPVSIGRPFAGRMARVLGPGGERQPDGVPGELCLGGLLARGYLGRPDLTAARFVPDPYADAPGARLYRTGDLVRRRPEGDLEFLGRIDDQVKIRGFRVEPGEVEAALLAHPGVREAAVLARNGRLVGWYVGEAGDLAAFLRRSLPEHMIPAAFVPLPGLPLTTHGKVDRKALPDPRPEAPAGFVAPRNEREERLAAIWRAVLGRGEVGVHDNFFQLGGDSILSIQVVARARRSGLLLTARQLFDHQTIAQLAEIVAVAGTMTAEIEGPVEGEVPLTPIQRSFFAEGRREPWRYNQSVLLVSRERLDRAALAAVLDRLVRHHDALRLRFVQEAGGWHPFHAPAAPVPLLEIDLPPEALEAAAEQLQSGLDLANGPLFTAALFHLPDGDRLLLTVHHLIVDGVSWRILLEDLVAEALPPKTTSWKRWAELLAAHSSAEEIPWWSALPAVPPLPLDADLDGGRAFFATEWDREETRALLQGTPYRTEINDLFLAALARAFAAWTGERTLLIDLEGHGREEIFPGMDLSRTVGWFTTIFPVALILPLGAGPRESILAVKETLRAVPGRGLGYGLLQEKLDLPRPQVSFNYLGRFGGQDGRFAFAPETVRGMDGEAVPGRHLFTVDLMVVNDRLRAAWTYDPGRHLLATVERLARTFRAELETLVEHCLSPGAGGYTPSDFPLAGLDQAALDRLGRGIEDLYPLAPLQEGLLFHSLYGAGGDPYFEQLTAVLEGPLDAPAFAAAWQRVIDRHTALRTGFLRQGLQLVRPRAEMPWTVEDWRGDAWWQEMLAADRARGFDLAGPPLMRLTLVREAADRHRLVWSSHHLVFDGWCLSLILAEVFALYRAPGIQLPPARPYRDYIAWLAHRDDTEAELHWQEALRGFAEPTSIPFDRAGEGEPFELSADLPAGELEALAQRLRLTLNTLVQGAWALLLSRYSGADDVVFGAVVSGRPAELPGVESIVGLFINTLPVRAVVSEEPASAWLARLQAGQTGLRQHQWTPLSRVQELSEVPAGEPLFSTLLAFENYPVDPSVSAQLGELRIVDAALSERTNYPLTLTVVARGDLSLRLTADPRYEPATAERLLAHLGNLLTALAGDAERLLRGLPMLSEGELRQVLVDWNDTAAPFPAASIPELFAEQAALRPDAIAVEQGDERLTYRELQERALRVARRLRLRPEQRVAVLAERSPELIVHLLAILQAGGAYLPLDPNHPPERRDWMVEDAAAIPLTLEETAPELPSVPPDALAYVMYTSGSTGTPKGVAVTHCNVVRLVRGADYAEMDHAWLGYAPAAFDASTLEIWGPLLNGGRLVLFPGRIGSLAEIARVIEDRGVTSAWLTAGLFHEMVDGRLDGLRPLRQLLAGGDVISPDHARRVRAAHPDLALINGYGPTEGTTFTCCHRILEVGETVPIGRPIANTHVYVLDRRLDPAPVGAWGELYAGGDGLARGYLDRPDLTAERFVPDPFGEGRLYRTGDRVRWRADGTLEFQGRLDSQLKIRGFRVEPGEVEAALLACPGVTRGAVAVVDKALAAFWVGEAQPDELRARLRERLPEPMVPSLWVPVADLPLTPNGKVDRRALAGLATPRRPAAGRVPPGTPLEENLVAAWAEVLERDPAEIGILDSFFELGGHSLLATRLASLLHSRLGLDVPIHLLFDTANLAELAGRILERGSPAGAGPIPRRPADLDPIPASWAQERLWFLDRLMPGSPAYNVSAALRLTGDLDIAALERAFGEVVRRHEVLRTTLAERDGNPVQRIAPPAGWVIPVIDLTGTPEEIERLAQEEALAPFDLATGPLLRTRLLRTGPREHVLLLTLHHVVTDLWSLGVLVREVVETCAGRPLPELPIQYADFAVWQRAALAGEALERQVAFWREELAGAPPALDLPTDRPRPQVPSHRGRSLPMALGPELSAAVGRLARERGATPFMVLLAALGALCARWSGQDDLVLGAPIANRQRSELEGLIGMFVNTLPLRVRTAGDPSFADLLAGVRRTALAAYGHQDVPFEKLVEELNPPRERGRHPVFQVVLAVQNVRQSRLDLSGLALEPLPSASTVAKFDLTLTLFEQEGGLTGDIEWATDLFDAGTVERLAEGLRTLLAAAVQWPGRRIGALPLLLPVTAVHQTASPGARGARAERVPPRTPTEELLAALWERVLEVERVGAFDDFFELGGHSLLATRLVTRIREAFGVELPVSAVFDAPTLAAQARAVASARQGESLPIVPVPRDGALPLSFAQERLWFLYRLDPSSPAYNVPLAIRLTGALDVPALERAFAELVRRHEALRTSFPDVDGEPVQRIAEPAGWTLPVIETHEVSRLALEDALAPFDLARGPLLRTRLLRLAPREHVLLLCLHHAVADLWSMKVLVEELAELYEGPLPDQPLPELPVQYADFAVWQRGWLAGAELERQIAYWRGELDGAPAALDLPTDRPRPPVLSHRGASLPFAFGTNLSSAVARLGRERGATPFMVLAAALGAVCARWSGQDDLVLGTPIANRQRPELEGLIGMFVNSLPIRVRLEGEPSFAGLLARVRRAALDAYEHQDVPFEKLVEELHPRRDRSRHPLFQAVLSVQNVRQRRVELPGLVLEPVEVATAATKFDLTATFYEAGDGLAGDVDWATDLFDAATVARLAGEVQALLAAAAESPETPLAGLPLLARGESLQLRAVARPERVPPRNPLEENLVEAAAEVLEREPQEIGVLDNFFDLGGHSLLATRFVSRLQARWGIEVPLQLVFDTPNLAGLADAILERELGEADDDLMDSLLSEMTGLKGDE